MRYGTGDALQLWKIGLQGRQDALVEHLLARQRAILRGQRFVLKGLEFGCDVTLSVLQRLSPPVILRHLRRVGVGNFDVETVYPVVLDFEVGNAATLAFACFKVDEKRAAIIVECAQFIEIGIKAVGNDATVADQCCGFRENRARQQVKHSRWCG